MAAKSNFRIINFFCQKCFEIIMQNMWLIYFFIFLEIAYNSFTKNIKSLQEFRGYIMSQVSVNLLIFFFKDGYLFYFT